MSTWELCALLALKKTTHPKKDQKSLVGSCPSHTANTDCGADRTVAAEMMGALCGGCRGLEGASSARTGQKTKYPRKDQKSLMGRHTSQVASVRQGEDRAIAAETVDAWWRPCGGLETASSVHTEKRPNIPKKDQKSFGALC